MSNRKGDISGTKCLRWCFGNIFASQRSISSTVPFGRLVPEIPPGECSSSFSHRIGAVSDCYGGQMECGKIPTGRNHSRNCRCRVVFRSDICAVCGDGSLPNWQPDFFSKMSQNGNRIMIKKRCSWEWWRAREHFDFPLSRVPGRMSSLFERNTLALRDDAIGQSSCEMFVSVRFCRCLNGYGIDSFIEKWRNLQMIPGCSAHFSQTVEALPLLNPRLCTFRLRNPVFPAGEPSCLQSLLFLSRSSIEHSQPWILVLEKLYRLTIETKREGNDQTTQ